MIDVLKTGIYSYISTSAFYSNITGLYADEYPQLQTVLYPHIIYYRLNNVPFRDSHGYFEPVFLQFNIFTDENTIVNSKKGNDLMDYLEDQFISLMDDATFNVTGYGMIKCLRGSSSNLPKANESTIWGRQIQYLIELEKI